MKEKGDMWVPLLKIFLKKKSKEDGDRRESVKKTEGERFFFFLSLLSSIYGVLTVGIRWVKNEKCSTRRGLHVSTKNKGFH